MKCVIVYYYIFKVTSKLQFRREKTFFKYLKMNDCQSETSQIFMKAIQWITENKNFLNAFPIPVHKSWVTDRFMQLAAETK